MQNNSEKGQVRPLFFDALTKIFCGLRRVAYEKMEYNQLWGEVGVSAFDEPNHLSIRRAKAPSPVTLQAVPKLSMAM